MNILEFFFGIFKEFFNTINVDIFGFGFTWLELLLAFAIIFVVLSFLKGVVGVGDHIMLDNILKRKENNKERENQVTSKIYSSSDVIDVWGDGTYLVPKSKYYGDD